MAAIQPEPGLAETEAEQAQRLKDEDKAKAEGKAFEEALEKDVKRIYVTPGLIAINVLVYVVMCSKGVDPLDPSAATLVEWGANYGPLINVQPWRLVTSAFVHAGLLHVSLNMFALWSSGHIVERLYGPRWFLLLYILCGLGASLVGLWLHPKIVSVGASGAIVGVYGCLLAFMLHPCEALSDQARGTQLKSLLAFFAYLIIAGIGDGAIDTAAHVGGAIIGFAIGSLYGAWLNPHLPHVASALWEHKKGCEVA